MIVNSSLIKKSEWLFLLSCSLSCDWFKDCLCCAGCHLLFAAQVRESLNEDFLDPQNYKKSTSSGVTSVPSMFFYSLWSHLSRPLPFQRRKNVIWQACKDKHMTTTKTGPHTFLNQENQLETAVQSCHTESCLIWKPPNARTHTHTHTQVAVCDVDFQPERAGLERQTVAGEAEPLWPRILSAGSISSESIMKKIVFSVFSMICLLHL